MVNKNNTILVFINTGRNGVDNAIPVQYPKSKKIFKYLYNLNNIYILYIYLNGQGSTRFRWNNCKR